MNIFTMEQVCVILSKMKLKREVKERLRLLQLQKTDIQLQIDATQQELQGLKSTQEEEDVYDAIKQVLDTLEG